MPVHSADAVGADGVDQFAAQQMRFGRLARSGSAGRRRDSHIVPGDQPGDQRRQQRQRDRGRVTAWHRDAVGPDQFMAGTGQLGQAVGPGAGVLGAVEFVPLFSIAEPEIRATVDDQHIVGQLGSNPGRCTMRECEENDIMTGKVVGGGVDDVPVGQVGQVRQVGAELRPSIGVRGQSADADLGMAGGQPHDLPARVTGAPSRRYRIGHVITMPLPQ